MLARNVTLGRRDICIFFSPEKATLPTAEAAQQARVFSKASGGNGTWDRLAEYLEKSVSNEEVFVIARSVAAPIATVFDMWATPALLAAWLPPARFTMTFQRADIRSGGEATFAMTNGDVTMYARREYRDRESDCHVRRRAGRNGEGMEWVVRCVGCSAGGAGLNVPSHDPITLGLWPSRRRHHTIRGG